MATAQVFLALCVAGVAVAAPQLGRSRSATGTGANEQQVVSNVISALGPSIARAVEEALSGLSGAGGQGRQEAALQQQRAEAAARAREEQRLRQQVQAERVNFDAEVSQDLGPTAPAVYNFEYKVADEQAQTYISREEQRDGSELVGKYSYVDATGALVTVEYTAGVDGYAETRSLEPGFVTMRAIPAWDGPLAGIDDVGTGSTAARGPAGAGTGFASGAGGSSASRFSSSSSSSSSSQADLIASILAALQPQIESAVTNAIA